MQVDLTNLTTGEAELVHWQYGTSLGHFKDALWDAIKHADLGNLTRLAQGFPEQVTAYQQFIGVSGYWEGVLKRAGLVKPKPAANDGDKSH
jgi:hypothetical protein